MFKPISISRPIVRTAAAACVGTIMGLAITASPGAGRKTQDAGTQSYALANPDRLRVPVRGYGCSALGWPNFEPKCRFDLTERAGDARAIRMIVLQ
jgi:hypothetical protein